MKFSLILCTIGRTKEVELFLNSLVAQTNTNFEVIVVDQNDDTRVSDIIYRFNSLKIKYLKSEKGLSRSRNLGILNATGDIIGFPDDDCTYPPTLLENVASFYSQNNFDILTGKTIDKDTKKIVAGKDIYISQILKASYILGSSTTLFIKNKRFEIKFDERFGLGAIFNAEEENELIFRLLKQGHTGFYNPNINYVYHPPSDLDFTDLKRARKRTIGLGAFIAKHILSKEGIMFFIKYNLLRPLFGMIIYTFKLDFIRARYYLNRWLGIWIGFFRYLKVNNETTI